MTEETNTAEKSEEKKQTFKIMDSETPQSGLKIRMPSKQEEAPSDPVKEEPKDDTKPDSGQVETLETPPAPELNDDIVLSYIRQRGREAESIEDLLRIPEEKVVEKEVELPENVAAYKKYHEETGRSAHDWAMLNRDFEKMDADQVLVEHLSMLHPEWSKKDVLSEINDEFGYDAEEATEAEIARIERKKVTAVANARKALDESKQKYAAPLASREFVVPEEEKSLFEEYKQHRGQSASQSDHDQKVAAEFSKQTESLFTSDFKGFEVTLDGKSYVYLPETPDKLIKSQINIRPILNELVFDENGRVKDPKDYHLRLAAFRDPAAFAKHFYEQGKADQVVDLEKESKNLNIDRKPNESQQQKKGGATYRILDDGNSSGRLTIKPPGKSI
jgi:hypothetical protein